MRRKKTCLFYSQPLKNVGILGRYINCKTSASHPAAVSLRSFHFTILSCGADQQHKSDYGLVAAFLFVRIFFGIAIYGCQDKGNGEVDFVDQPPPFSTYQSKRGVLDTRIIIFTCIGSYVSTYVYTALYREPWGEGRCYIPQRCSRTIYHISRTVTIITNSIDQWPLPASYF